MTNKQAAPTLPPGIYGITAEKYSRGRTNVEVAAEMIRGGVTTLQYREKKHQKSVAEMLKECRAIRRITREYGVLFIVNDHVDLAILADADGVHVGQDDLPVAEVRSLLGPDRIIGLSTHNPEQARQAVRQGADYIGVGPLFSTKTKEDVCAPVGLEYLEHIAAGYPLPFVAIGGIKSHNIHQVIERGASTICLVTEIVGSDDIAQTVNTLRSSLP